MKKKSFIIVLFFLLASVVNIVQCKTIEKTPIYKISNENNVRNVRDWPSISLLYTDQYHTPEELVEELMQINATAPGIVDLFTIGKSIEGRDIFCLRITEEQNTLPKAGVLFVAHHHAREQITIEMALRFMLVLVNNYGLDQEITNYINTEEIFFIPSLNPDGLHYVVGNETNQGNPWLRRNVRPFDNDKDDLFDEDPPEDTNGDGIISEFTIHFKNQQNEWVASGDQYYEGNDNDGDGLVNEDPIGGVDLNRNYDFRWGDSTCDSGGTTNTLHEDYPGTAPFSEPETQAYRDFVEYKSFATAISLHSGINGTYFPWAAEPYWAEKELYGQIYTNLKDLLPANFLSYPTQTESIGYTCAGEWGDWMYAAKHCLVPLTFEIYHNKSSNELSYLISEDESQQIWRWDGIYEMFAPAESAIESLWNEIQYVFFYWLGLTPRLEIFIKSVTGGKNASDSLRVKLSCASLSPLIGSIDKLNIAHKNLTSVLRRGTPVTFSEIPAGKSVDRSFDFELKQKFSSGTNITLLIGNEYIGYRSITIQEDQVGDPQVSSGFIPVLIVIAIFLLVKIRKNTSRKD
ncbi:MAG: M14 family zinc carboxypeptidase [Candidatus Hodarchaeota archaeon]